MVVARVIALVAGLTAGMPAMALNTARFDFVEYRNYDPGPTPGAGQYRNPIIAGYYPDPSVVRVGRDFYLVNSTFSWFPGIPVWHSRDLVHWTQIGNAIDRPDQLDFSRLGMSKGVFAPAIAHDRGTFYIVNTCVDCGGNYVITARDPRGPWSRPVWLKNVGGIDPSLFFDADGSAWLVNNDLPAGGERYEGHRAIWLRRFNPKTLQAEEPGRVIADGSDPARKPIWIEGPHLFRRGGYYYLTAAEGGTDLQHSQVIFRSRSVTGPYEAAPSTINPILTQRDLDPRRPAPVTTAGHADLVELPDGSWWSVFLATRPYRGNLYNTGRETFLLPVTWRDDWPTVLRGSAIPLTAARPSLPAGQGTPTSGAFVTREEFGTSRLGPEWVTMRTPSGPWWRVERGALLLDARPERVGDGKRPSLVARRQQSAEAEMSTRVTFAPAEGEEAGLAAVQNDAYFLSLAVARTGGRTVVRVARRAGRSDPPGGRIVASAPLTSDAVDLRIRAHGADYDFDYAVRPGVWLPLARGVDGTNLSTSRAGGFVGTLIGPYAQTAAGASALPVAEESFRASDRLSD